jgi:ADP-ribose pyrophosphatase
MLNGEDRVVYDEWLKINQRNINGKKYDILNDFDAVAAVIENEYHELLLVKQFRPALLEDTIEIPSGILDNTGESAEEGLLRELQEEARLRLDPGSIRLIITYKPNVGFSNSVLRVYYSKVRKADVITGSIPDNDVRESLWISLKDLEDQVKTGRILDVKTIFAWLWLKNNIMMPDDNGSGNHCKQHTP